MFKTVMRSLALAGSSFAVVAGVCAEERSSGNDGNLSAAMAVPERQALSAPMFLRGEAASSGWKVRDGILLRMTPRLSDETPLNGNLYFFCPGVTAGDGGACYQQWGGDPAFSDKDLGPEDWVNGNYNLDMDGRSDMAVLTRGGKPPLLVCGAGKVFEMEELSPEALAQANATFAQGRMKAYRFPEVYVNPRGIMFQHNMVQEYGRILMVWQNINDKADMKGVTGKMRSREFYNVEAAPHGDNTDLPGYKFTDPFLTDDAGKARWIAYVPQYQGTKFYLLFGNDIEAEIRGEADDLIHFYGDKRVQEMAHVLWPQADISAELRDKSPCVDTGSAAPSP